MEINTHKFIFKRLTNNISLSLFHFRNLFFIIFHLFLGMSIFVDISRDSPESISHQTSKDEQS
jgi:hypothetical protein